MSQKTLDALKKMEEVLDKMTPEELLILIEKYGITKETSGQYAKLERMIREKHEP